MTLEPIALIFKLNNGLVARTLEGLGDDDVWWRPPQTPGIDQAGGGNPIAWLVGHLASTRGSLLRELGHPFSTGLGKAFIRGAALQDASAYPSRAAIEEAWNATHTCMRDAFAGLTDEWLRAPSTGYPLPGAKTMGDRLGFFAFHESYHVGQMAYVRRLFGHSGVAG